jgi:hypothetical protein
MNRPISKEDEKMAKIAVVVGWTLYVAYTFFLLAFG